MRKHLMTIFVVILAVGVGSLSDGDGAAAASEEKFLEAVRSLIALTRYDEAIALLSEGIEAQSFPQDTLDDALLLRGDAHYRLGDYARAKKDYDESYELDPDDPVVLISRSLADHETDRQGKAGTLRPAEDLRLRRLRAGAYFDLQEFENMMDDYSEVMRWTSDRGYLREATFGMGVANAELVEQLEDELRRRPGDRAIIGRRALLHAKMGRNASAIRDIELVLGANANDRVMLKHRGAALAALGHYSDALRDFEAAARLGSDPISIAKARGQVFFLIGRYADASQELRTVAQAGEGANRQTVWNVIWYTLARLRAGQQPDHAFLEEQRILQYSDWPMGILLMILGRIEREEISNWVPAGADGRVLERRRNEVLFFDGQMGLMSGDIAGASESFRRALGANQFGELVERAAREELKRIQ